METSNAFKNLSSMVEMVDYLVQLQAERDDYKRRVKNCDEIMRLLGELLDAVVELGEKDKAGK
jgi:hypothetical protein